MDEGGIYEDGTPEEIFDHPKKERTVRFIRHLKVLEKTITSKNFDFLGFNTEVEEFGRKNQISQKSIYRTQAAFEELCMQIILPKLEGNFKFYVAIEYSADDETVNMQIKYTGERFNPLESDNELSLKLLEGITESIVHNNRDDGEYTNVLMVDVKEK